MKNKNRSGHRKAYENNKNRGKRLKIGLFWAKIAQKSTDNVSYA
jgi:hypothetical protein